MTEEGPDSSGLPPKLAVALDYEPDEDEAPRVVASGREHMAERIIELAKEAGVEVHEDPVLAGKLAELDAGSVIPLELYQAVAEVLAAVYRVDDELKARREEADNMSGEGQE